MEKYLNTKRTNTAERFKPHMQKRQILSEKKKLEQAQELLNKHYENEQYSSSSDSDSSSSDSEYEEFMIDIEEKSKKKKERRENGQIPEPMELPRNKDDIKPVAKTKESKPVEAKAKPTAVKAETSINKPKIRRPKKVVKKYYYMKKPNTEEPKKEVPNTTNQSGFIRLNTMQSQIKHKLLNF
jgi:hypothetical protein